MKVTFPVINIFTLSLPSEKLRVFAAVSLVSNCRDVLLKNCHDLFLLCPSGRAVTLLATAVRICTWRPLSMSIPSLVSLTREGGIPRDVKTRIIMYLLHKLFPLLMVTVILRAGKMLLKRTPGIPFFFSLGMPPSRVLLSLHLHHKPQLCAARRCHGFVKSLLQLLREEKWRQVFNYSTT